MKKAELQVVSRVQDPETGAPGGLEQVPFTLGALVEALQGAGLLTDEAIGLARAVEKRYRQGSSKQVKLENLLSTLVKLTRESHGDEIAERLRQQTPPFVPLRLRAASGELRPFSRRDHAGSLEQQGFSFKEANVVARQVEQELRSSGASVVSEAEVNRYTALSVGARYGALARARFEARTGQPSELTVLGRGGERLPYSRGILAQSLMALGLGPELSHQLAKRTEAQLWQAGSSEVSKGALRAALKRLLQREAGDEFVRRYELLRRARRPERPLVILIGGAPGVGKSSLASALAYRLGAPRIVSSDSVRQALRSLISAELSPTLHTSSFTAWRTDLLPSEANRTKPSRKRVIRGFQRQAQQLSTALGAIIERSVTEATSVVLEGIHLVPGFTPLGAASAAEATVVELVLAVPDEALHRRYFSAREARASRRRSEHYLEHFEEIRIIQDFYLAQAQAHGVPVLEASNFDRLVDSAIEHVLGAVLAGQHEPEARAEGGESGGREGAAGSALEGEVDVSDLAEPVLE